MEKLLFGNKTTFQSVRIARAGGVPTTAHISHYANKINALSRVSNVGGVVLVGVGLTASSMQIARISNRQEKNEIFVETIASTAVGVVTPFLVGVFLVSNPIGWGTALVLAVGGAAVGYGAGKIARYSYDRYGRKVDFVSGTGVEQICQIINMYLLFDIAAGLTVGVGIGPIFIVIMHLFIPKPVLDKYFKPPYFKAGECAFLTGILLGPIRTVMFMRVLGFPGSGKKRGMTEAYKLAPHWYVILSRIILIYFFGTFILYLFVIFIFGIDMTFYAK